MPRTPYYLRPGRTQRIAEVFREAREQSARQARIAKLTPEKLKRFWGLVERNPWFFRVDQRFNVWDGEHDIDVAIAQLERFDSAHGMKHSHAEPQAQKQVEQSAWQNLFGFLH